MDNQQRLDRLEQKLDMLLSHLGVLTAQNGHETHNLTPPAPPALEVDIDGPRGNPEVRFMPKRWEGANYKGKAFSECEPEFLDMLAETFDYFARKEDETGALDKNGGPKSRWTRLDAGRARAWAKRLRGSHGGNGGGNGGSISARRARPVPVAAAAPPIDDFSAGFPAQEDDDDIPFLTSLFNAAGGVIGAPAPLYIEDVYVALLGGDNIAHSLRPVVPTGGPNYIT
jgi:hypothetical protein